VGTPRDPPVATLPPTTHSAPRSALPQSKNSTASPYVGGAPPRRRRRQPATKHKLRAEVGPPTKSKNSTASLFVGGAPPRRCRRQPATKPEASRRGRPSHKS